MKLQLNGLIIDKHQDSLEELPASFKEEIEFDFVDSVNTFLKALEYHMDMEFQICLISDSFPLDEITGFLRDYEKLGRKQRCIFVQFRNRVDIEYRRESLQPVGIATVISKAGDDYDRAALLSALEPIIAELEQKELEASLESIVGHLMEEVDKVAQDRKRGAKTKLSQVYAKHIADSAKKYERIVADYFDKLAVSTQDAEPFTVTELEVPESILTKNLPHLSKAKYKGASNRVWNMLLQKHGLGPDQSKQLAGDDSEEAIPSAPVEPEEPVPEPIAPPSGPIEPQEE